MSNADASDSLAKAARATFPPEHCKVVAMREQENLGYVLFDTRPSGAPYLYGVEYERVDGRWREGSSGNGPGWSRIALGSEAGILTEWGQAPGGSDRVRMQFQGQLREDEVSNGAYLVVWWNVPNPSPDFPFVKAFRIAGEWITQ